MTNANPLYRRAIFQSRRIANSLLNNLHDAGYSAVILVRTRKHKTIGYAVLWAPSAEALLHGQL